MKGKFILLITGILMAASVFSQGIVKGRVIDATTQKPMKNVHIILDNGKNGVITNNKGQFLFHSDTPKGIFSLESLGYKTLKIPFKIKGKTTLLPDIALQPETYTLNEINITAGLVTDKDMPVNVSTISSRSIKSQLGDQPLPMALNSIPGVFSVRDGGGSGDATLSIRGFKQDNVALLLNGVPINGEENGLVYWSNWLGLSDAAVSIQVQKGPGFSNLSSNAVGGSINIITRSNNRPKGGSFSFQTTDYGNRKTTLNLNSGKMGNGWNLSFMGSYYSGKGYVDATYVHGFSYFFSANKQLNAKNHLNISLLGSPQHHGQRTLRLSAKEEQLHGNKFNKDWGGLDGKILNASENFYHKPFLSINHDLKIDNKRKLSNTVFVSYGSGGGKWSESFNYAPSIFTYRTASGQIDWPEIYNQNAQNTRQYVLANGDTVTGYSRNVLTDFLASNIQTGFMSTYEQKLNPHLTLTAGVYYRYLNSFLREKITNLMGGKFFIEDYAWSLSGVAGRRQLMSVGDIIKVDNNTIIQHVSAYTKLSFKNKRLRAYVSLNGNNQWYRRVDRFNYITHTKSPVVSRAGFDMRAGISYSLNLQNNFYLNTAYISRAPYFKYVFGNFNNTPVSNLENDRVKTIEAGYRFTHPGFNATIGAFYTQWDNVSMLSNEYVQLSDNRQSRAMVHGLNSIHKGIETQVEYRLNNRFKLGAMASFGDYRWQNDVSATLINNNNVVIDTVNVYARNLYVGGTAQQQLGAYTDFQLLRFINVRIEWAWYNKLFADFDPINRNNPDNRNQPYSFPAYQVVNAYISIPFQVASLPALLQINGYNLLNNIHIEKGNDGKHNNLTDFRGFWSFGINFNLTLKIFF